jgi:hypothetical protein
MKTDPSATVAEAIRRHRETFLKKHPPNAEVRKILGLLPLCRTSALGGHLYRCGDCGYEQPRYNSCGNRHCPNCQVAAREKWLAEQEAALLDLPYFHVVFTLPANLQPLILQNKTEGYNLLFGCAAETLLKFGRDPKHGLGGQLGFTAVLHTWNQTLGPHAHLHVLIPAGALSADKEAFTRARNAKWLFPVRALSRVFRALFLKRLRLAHANGRLQFHGRLAGLNDADAFAAMIGPLTQTDWVVYAKAPFAGPESVLAYLGRYTHRVGLTNARILKVTDRQVLFAYRDPQDASRKKTLALGGAEFLRRFFLHVLPKGFTRIRHYGFLGNAVRRANLPLIRLLLGQIAPEPEEETLAERIARVYAIDLDACPCCGTGRMAHVKILPVIRCKSPPA